MVKDCAILEINELLRPARRRRAAWRSPAGTTGPGHQQL
nr:MAG TPA: hypothetical protein [Caudoviricetes sp.]